MKALKKAGKIVVYALLIIVFLAAVLAFAASLNKSENGVSGVLGYTFSIVQTNSMHGTIEVGDFIVGKAYDPSTDEIHEDDIVTYKSQIQGVATTITHRVTSVITDQGSIVQYETWGDNRESNPVPDDSYRTDADIVSVYKFTVPLIGPFINFLKEPVGFILCVVLPLAAFIVWEVIDAVRIYNRVKRENMSEEEVAAQTAEDVKDAIIREYLAKQAAEAAAKAAGNETADREAAKPDPDTGEKKE